MRYLTLFLLQSALLSAQISSNRCHYLIQKGNLDTVFDILTSSQEQIPQEVIQQMGETLLTSALKSQNADIQLAALYGASLTNSMGFIQYAELGLKSESLQTQLASLSLIASTSHRDSEHLINTALRSNYIPVRLEALWLLSMFHSQNAYTQLEALYAKASDELRLYLLPLFAIEGSTASQDFLSQVCRLSSGELQSAALFALSTLSTQEKHPLTTPPFLDPITLESFLAYAANRRDSVPQETIEEYTKHPNEFIRLAACVLLAKNNIFMLQTIEDLSRCGNPFAISALGKLPLSDQSPLFGLTNHPEENVRINAGLSLLAHKQPQALSSILEIVQSEKEDSCFRPQVSPGGTMTIWVKVPNLSLRTEEKGYVEEQSLRFREAVLAQSLALPEEQFLQIANSVKTCKELLPLLSVLLENKKSEKAREFLKNTYENPPSLFAKLYVAKSLITLNEKGPWNDFALDWLESEKGLKLFHPRPFLPWFMQPDPKLHDLSFQERSRLALDLLSALIQSNRIHAQKCIISWMKETDPATRTVLAGLILQT